MTVAVTLLDGSEIEVECPNGRHTTAKEMRVSSGPRATPERAVINALAQEPTPNPTPCPAQDLVASFVDMSEENFGLFGIWVMSSSLRQWQCRASPQFAPPRHTRAISR